MAFFSARSQTECRLPDYAACREGAAGSNGSPRDGLLLTRHNPCALLSPGHLRRLGGETWKYTLRTLSPASDHRRPTSSHFLMVYVRPATHRRLSPHVGGSSARLFDGSTSSTCALRISMRPISWRSWS